MTARGKDRDTITKIHGGKVTIELEDWRDVLGVIKAELLELRDELGDGARAAGGCDGACAGHGGCDFEAGEPPERVFVCKDGHVILELEV